MTSYRTTPQTTFGSRTATNWLMIVGNRAVAALIPNSDGMFPHQMAVSHSRREPLRRSRLVFCGFHHARDRAIRHRAMVASCRSWMSATDTRLHCDRPTCGCPLARNAGRRGAKRKLPALSALRHRACADAPLGRCAQFSFAPRSPLMGRPTAIAAPPVFRAPLPPQGRRRRACP